MYKEFAQKHMYVYMNIALCILYILDMYQHNVFLQNETVPKDETADNKSI